MRRMITLSLLVVLAAAVVAMMPTGDTTDDLQAVLREMRELRTAYYERKRGLESRIDSARDAVKKLDADLDELKREEARLAGDETTIAEEVERLTKTRDAKVTERDGYVATARSFVATEEKRLTSVMPYRTDSRGRRLEAVRSSERAADCVAAAWAYFQAELKIARSVEIYSDQIGLPDGRQKHARLLRCGERLLALVTEDGRDVFQWIPGEGWVDDAARIRPEAIRHGVEILGRLRAPGLVALPMRTGRGVNK